MKNIFLIMLLFFLGTFSLNAALSTNGYEVLDRVCVLVAAERPILLSDIKKTAASENMSFASAQKALLRDRLLWVYAKKRQYDLSQIKTAAKKYLADILRTKDLTIERFQQILMKPPYLTTVSQYMYDIETAYLKNYLKSNLIKRNLSGELEKESLGALLNAFYHIVFISISKDAQPKTTIKKPTDRKLTSQFQKANQIRSAIMEKISIDELKRRYGSKKNISIVGPNFYKKGDLEKKYEERLIKDPEKIVTDPFLHNGSITMIWKVEKDWQELDSTTLEKLTKELYEREAIEKLDAAADSMLTESTVIIKGCSE